MTRFDFNSLATELYPSLYRFARSLTRNDSDAADLAQQTFLIFGQRHAQVRDTAAVRGWLQQTLFREFLRSRRRDSRWTGPEALDEAIAADDHTVLGADELALVREAIDTLPTPLRDIIRLRYDEELDYSGIASRLGVPVGTVMSRLARARTVLAQALAAHRADLAVAA